MNRWKKPPNRRRNQSGSMILFSVIAMCIVIALVVVGVGMSFLMMSHNKAQNKTDEITLTAAQVLNDHDRAGQLNNLIARCRELVYTSRQNYTETASNYRHLEPLARQLLDESRQSAYMIENERQHLVDQEIKQLKDLARENPEIETVKVGYLEGVPSNVELSNGIPELIQSDTAAGYLQRESGLYYGDINARLPGQDADLNFRISSLPAPIKGTIAPGRLTNASTFKETAQVVGHNEVAHCEHIPSAVQLQFKMKLKTLDDKQGKDVAVSATAACNGAEPAP